MDNFEIYNQQNLEAEKIRLKKEKMIKSVKVTELMQNALENFVLKSMVNCESKYIKLERSTEKDCENEFNIVVKPEYKKPGDIRKRLAYFTTTAQYTCDKNKVYVSIMMQNEFPKYYPAILVCTYIPLFDVVTENNMLTWKVYTYNNKPLMDTLCDLEAQKNIDAFISQFKASLKIY